MTTLFISDLHLHENRPLVTEAFFSFLNSQTREASSLYILGDLFDAWVGDDDESPLNLRVAEALRTLSQDGTQIYFQHGNRDFLLGHKYAERAHMTLLPELYVLENEGALCLLAHGDQFCTQDVSYQQFRTMVRNTSWQKEFLTRPLTERKEIAKQLREKSREANSLKAEDIMDVTPSEIEKTLLEKQCRVLIHGHTHRPAHHKLTLSDGLVGERIVLGDWDSTYYFLKQDKHRLELIQQAFVSVTIQR